MTTKFIGIQYPGQHPVAAFTSPVGKFVLNESSLRQRINNLERDGYDTTQERIALKALLGASE